ncbi:MAG: peroxide stress protein YaaA [Saprospiraceae bacterium]|nr:peroxide stress protein YaaA [Saprospiraceae bacterium]
MITVLSPAKNLNTDIERKVQYSQPRHLKQSAQLISKLRTFSKPKLQDLMSISKDLALLNQQRYQAYDEVHSLDNSTPAVFTFSGDVYRGLEAEHLDDKTLDYMNDHLRILSGLYGILRPFDLIQPYRLEMGTSLPVRRKKNLYEFWGDTLTNTLNEDIRASKSSHVVNLASDEYWSAINTKQLTVPVIKVNFLEWRKGKYRFLSFNAKRARGMMTRFIMEERIEEPENLIGFDIDNYHYNSDLSDERTYIFTRE